MSSIFTIITEAAFSLIALFVLYDIFIGDYISDKLSLKRKNKDLQSNVEKLARVKMISDDTKDIERFITDNAQYLSSDNVEQLVSRIEMLKADKVIAGDSLKTRIDALEPEEEEEAEKPKTRAKRK